ncbi:hypothetical protein B0J12DRAFT_67026 [Macrophomina phaseolina]|uniref:Uncharacterized protein n=1 Tax=Macrophomina phaseolina TaxID=35725 RepID=A0ABQ8GFL9_9PEZI|nr:hypothetical protein B0J12DRAFT_67026 [Macrophomina phaseolina]
MLATTSDRLPSHPLNHSSPAAAHSSPRPDRASSHSRQIQRSRPALRYTMPSARAFQYPSTLLRPGPALSSPSRYLDACLSPSQSSRGSGEPLPAAEPPLLVQATPFHPLTLDLSQSGIGLRPVPHLLPILIDGSTSHIQSYENMRDHLCPSKRAQGKLVPSQYCSERPDLADFPSSRGLVHLELRSCTAAYPSSSAPRSRRPCSAIIFHCGTSSCPAGH